MANVRQAIRAILSALNVSILFLTAKNMTRTLHKKASKREMQAMLKIAKSTYLHSQVSRNLQIRFWLKLSMFQIGVFYYR